MNAKEFMLKRDAEFGEAWSDDNDSLAEAFEEYAAIKVVNAAQQSVQADGACESCKLQFTSSCPSLLGKLCSYYQPRR